MARYRAAIIGCGRRGQGRGSVFGIAESHAFAYETNPATTLVAAADINKENLGAFCTDHTIRGYHDYREMLEKERPDIVSVCTWPPLHADMTVHAAEAGARAVWCEKPMTLSLAEADRMLVACEKHHTLLQVNHMRRYAATFQKAREFIKSGRIGQLLDMEASVPDWDLLSWGTHWVDMLRYFVDDQPATWVTAQVDCRKAKRMYDHYVEDYSIAYIAFENGVRGFLEHGEDCVPFTGVRVYGSEGIVEIEEGKGARALVRGASDWLSLGSTTPFELLFAAALADLIASIEEPGRPLLLSGQSARATTEMILAVYESAYRRGRVSLPLDVDDFPLERLVKAETQTMSRP